MIRQLERIRTRCAGCVLLAFLMGLNVVLPTSSSSCMCDDRPPPGSSQTCAEHAKAGQCARKWMGDHCACSCNSCYKNKPASAPASSQAPPSTKNTSGCACADQPPPYSTLSCAEQKENGKCSRAWMQGYCKCSCGHPECTTGSADSSSGNANQESGLLTPSAEGVRKWLEGLLKGDSTSFENPPSPPLSQPSSHTRDSLSSDSWNSGFLESDSQLGAMPDGGVKFAILHVNDFHVRFEPINSYMRKCYDDEDAKGECQGGIARIFTAIRQEREALRKQGLATLLLDAGDDNVGTSWAQEYHGKDVVHFFNQLGFDAMTPGNHDFDFGADEFYRFITALKHPVLTCNIDASARPDIQGQMVRYIIKTIGGHKIGVLGVSTEVTAEWSDPGPLKFDGHEWAARSCAQELTQQGVKIIIALTHVGYTADEWMARKVEDLDLIIGGHSHTFLYSGDAPVLQTNDGDMQDKACGRYPTWVDSWVQANRSIPVVQAYWGSRYVGKIIVTFDKNGELKEFDGKPILLGGSNSANNVIPAEDIVAQVKKWKYWTYD